MFVPLPPSLLSSLNIDSRSKYLAFGGLTNDFESTAWKKGRAFIVSPCSDDAEEDEADDGKLEEAAGFHDMALAECSTVASGL